MKQDAGPILSEVELVSPERLLRHAFGTPLRRPALLLLFQPLGRLREDRQHLRERVTWLWDLPHAQLAVFQLRLTGWLLIACAEEEQAWRLLRSTSRSGRLSARLILPGSTRGLHLDGWGTTGCRQP